MIKRGPRVRHGIARRPIPASDAHANDHNDDAGKLGNRSFAEPLEHFSPKEVERRIQSYLIALAAIR